MLTIKKTKATANRQHEELTVSGVLVERLEEASGLLVDVLKGVKQHLKNTGHLPNLFAPNETEEPNEPPEPTAPGRTTRG